MERPSWAPKGVDMDRPSPARMYDYVLGGTHNFPVDRKLYDQVVPLMPDIVPQARASRAFMRRAVRFCAEAGMRQFLDLGSGIPTRGNVHEVAHQVTPEARVMYVDIDPTAVAHSREILAGNDRARVIQADLRQPESILTNPEVRSLLDFDQPMAVLMVNVLHFVFEDPSGIVATFRDAVASGSYLVVAHLSAENRPTEVAEGREVSRRMGHDAVPRTRAEVERLFAGFELVEPGVVWAHEWRPDLLQASADGLDRPFGLSCVGRKP
ncbi:MAG TPA: SAM-dependent methyltransferase [Micromonosporaceae bacterium]|nr:SAM-dependent methyltransferase [Micromonosporaceae bacterium]